MHKVYHQLSRSKRFAKIYIHRSRREIDERKYPILHRRNYFIVEIFQFTLSRLLPTFRSIKLASIHFQEYRILDTLGIANASSYRALSVDTLGRRRLEIEVFENHDIDQRDRFFPPFKRSFRFARSSFSLFFPFFFRLKNKKKKKEENI